MCTAIGVLAYWPISTLLRMKRIVILGAGESGADAAVYQRDYAEEVYEILEKAQITYAQKTDVYKVVKELGTEAVPVLVSMNLNPSLLGVLMEILTMGI